MENKNNSSSGTGFAWLLQIAFIVLKLCKVIDWPWIWVLAPTWGAFALIIVGSAIIMITAAIRVRHRR